MAHRLKKHVGARIMEVVKLKNDPSIFSLISSHLTVGKSQSGNNIEFEIPIKTLKRLLPVTSKNININVSQIKSAVSDDIIHNVYETVVKKDTNLVFQMNKNIFIQEVLQDILKDPVLWKTTLSRNIVPHSAEKKIIIDYSSPNIAKPFHMGHLRSTIIGNFIGNILEFLSHSVVRINYLGDWGTQYGLLQIGLDICGFSESMIKQNPIQLLYQAYVEANKKAESDPSITAKAREAFLCLEEGSASNMEKWQQYRKYTVQELQDVYKRLGVYFDEYNWESMYSAKEINDVLQLLEEKGILKTHDDGKKVVEINSQRHVPVLKSDGSTLYLTRDIAAALDRYKRHNFTEMLYVVDNAQVFHFDSLFGVLSQLELPWASSLKHIKFGRIQGMSTRRGSVIFLKDILDELQDIMRIRQQESPTTKVLPGESEKTTDILGISAVIINDLKHRRQRDYEFDWNRALQVNGDTGVKLQYTHCRLWNLEKNCGVSLPVDCDSSVFKEPEAIHLVRNIARFEDMIKKSYEELEACILVNYLMRFSDSINRAFGVLRVKDEDVHIGSQRLLLFHSCRIVLNMGMKLLGLQPLQQM